MKTLFRNLPFHLPFFAQVHAVEGLLRKRVAKYWAAAAVSTLKEGSNVLQMYKCPLPVAALLSPPVGSEKHGCTVHIVVFRSK
jgi:hypothetical protein